MADNLKALGVAAGLTPEEKKKLDDFDKSLQIHKQLSNMPADAANQKYNTLTASQKVSLQTNFGNEDPTVTPKRGWLGTAWHYTGGAVGQALGYAGSHVLAGLNNVSDVMTRLYRTGAIAADQGVNLSDAWTIANDNGNKVFSPNRIVDARTKFGNDAVDVAMRIAGGEKPSEIIDTVTPEQKKYVRLLDPTNKIIEGIAPDKIEAARGLFQDTLDAVQAAKYSPGRQIANLVTPAQLEGSGLFYKAVSGAVDAAYRVLADPLLIAGKAKRAWDVTNYAVDVVVGQGKVAETFAKPAVQNFWNQYGQGLEQLTKAQASKSPEAIIRAKQNLATLAPEFGDDVVKAFQSSHVPVTNAKTAQAFFENSKQAIETFKGSAGRQRVIIPQMDMARKARVAALTTGRKVFNIDAVGPKLVDDYFYGGATTSDGIAETIINGQKQIVDQVTAKTNFKGIARFSTAYIQHRIDRVKAAFTPMPIFEKEAWDVTSADASAKIYQLARLVMPQRESKLLAETFANIDEVGKRKDVYYGLWGTIAEIRGLNATAPGQQIVRYLTGKTQAIFGLDDAFRDKGSMPSDFSNFVAAPGMKDLDRAAARNTLFQKMMGLANSDFANRMTSGWSFLTLAGPRYALRNAGEDLMVNLAIGQSPWGLAKQYHLNNRINTFLAAAQKVEGGAKWYNNPLGAILRVTNKKDVNKYAGELTAIKVKFEKGQTELSDIYKAIKEKPAGHPDITSLKIRAAELKKELEGGIAEQTRQVFATAVTEGRINRWREQLGMKPMNLEDAEILKEHIKYGNLENALGDVSEGGMNAFTGNDYISRAEKTVKETGVSTHALTIKKSAQDFVKKPGERAFTVRSLHQQDEASMYSWMFSLSRYANDELGGIAVANLDKPEIAIGKMVAWMTKTKQGNKFLSDARLMNDMSATEIAELNFMRARSHFVKRNNNLNMDLLNKIRVQDKEGNWIVSGNIGLSDLPRNADDIPMAIIGPTLVPAVEAERMTASIVQNGWTFLGLSNARMSRQPIVLDEIVKTRKQFKKAGFENKWIESYQRGIDPKDAVKMATARENALKDLATVVEERAISQTIAYVDNPLVRTQLAWNIKNFARFYRATEDFYRRMFRVVKYNPEALVKAALTYEGITHSGWVQQDDQGNSYFVYPGISQTYGAVQNVLDRLGIGNEFKIPMPVNFGANVKMLTPSLNPDSLMPTFSGPVAGISFTALTQLVNIWSPGAADTIKGYALGKYSVDQPILSAVLPAHINRLYAAMNQDDRNSQYASAWRKAVTYLEASGHGLPKRYDKDGNLIPPTPGEQEAYRLAVKNTTLGILGMRFMFGFFAPASPQVTLKSDMAQWVSDNGQANFKQVWNNLLSQHPGDYDTAMAKWVELFPNQVPFTITESERKTIAPLNYANEAGMFVDQNKDVFTKYPSAAGFLIPHKSGFSWDAYKSFKDLGVIQNKRVDDYLREVQTAADLQQYYTRKNEYDLALSESVADFQRTQIRADFDAWKKTFFAGRPLVQEELSQGSEKAIKRLETLDELTVMLDANLNIRPKTEGALRQMLNTYNNYKTERANLEAMNVSKSLVDSLQANALSELQKLAEYNENTKAAYDVLFSRLPGIGD